MRAAVLALTGLLGATTVQAQGNDQSTSGAAASETRGAVMIGAGSTSNVTTGASGETEGSAKTLRPIDVDMPYPRVSGPFGMTEPLPIADTPARLYCDIIADAAARARCAN